MSIMAKTPSGYKKIGSAYLGERPVDKVFNANGDVVYALQRELTGVPPLLFKGKEQSELLNYRIYGDTVDGNGVGDLVESGEHAGEYEVSVTVEGKNLLQNTATSQTINGVTFTVNGDGSVTCNGTSTSQYYSLLRIPCYLVAGNYTISGCPVGGGSSKYRADIRISPNGGMVGGDADIGAGVTMPIDESGWYDYTIRIQGGYTVDDLTFKPMIRKADIADDTYEPYHAPITTPIYLPEPIKMVGDEAEYIDYAEQKMHRVRKNLWSGVVEQGSVSTLGQYANDSSRIRSKNILLSPGTYTISCNLGIRCIYAYNNSEKVSLVVDNGGGAVYRNTFTIPSGANNVSISLRAFNASGTAISNVTPSDFIWGQIEKGSEATTYEPYIEDTDLDVTLPALPTLKGTNTLSVDTEVQPSRMDIKGRIKSLT